ncbi:hypothetical protein MNBD_GAMMA12-72 [hydrothermal vent metagenome]|uniref:Uncharacterized protein n=1 Tax=hydrothermal vent metagenome TaxID=652676 RepID=A0A3B0YRW0_9ZZZZ
MTKIVNLTEDELTRALTYAGFILVAFELVKSLIVNPIKGFYAYTTFGDGAPFTSLEEDVLFRHKNQFEACLLYLRDFMEAIDSEDLLTIQALRKHRNDLAHELPAMLHNLDIENNLILLEKTDKALFKLSNYNTYMEIGSDPEFQNSGINWDTIKGPEYELFEEILTKVKALQSNG